uniref:BPTI/Kunitz inhibitor domain-containing protein n=1 Tax=Strigamia maritima TaxID=126957 RepID=T1JAL4_STRMM
MIQIANHNVCLILKLMAAMACAPRYVHFSANFRRREPIGACFVARNSFTQFQEYSPCRTSCFADDN